MISVVAPLFCPRARIRLPFSSSDFDTQSSLFCNVASGCSIVGLLLLSLPSLFFVGFLYFSVGGFQCLPYPNITGELGSSLLNILFLHCLQSHSIKSAFWLWNLLNLKNLN